MKNFVPWIICGLMAYALLCAYFLLSVFTEAAMPVFTVAPIVFANS